MTSKNSVTYDTAADENDEEALNDAGCSHDPSESNEKEHAEYILDTRQEHTHKRAHLRRLNQLASSVTLKSARTPPTFYRLFSTIILPTSQIHLVFSGKPSLLFLFLSVRHRQSFREAVILIYLSFLSSAKRSC